MPIETMVDWSDSHYQYVKDRVVGINPARAFGGIVQARAWPLKEVQFETFYMLVGKLDPMPMNGYNSWFAPGYSEAFRWIWQIKGTDINANVAANRGDRYRTNSQMVQEILQGMYPGFCEKKTWSVVPDVDNNPILTATSFFPAEYVWWAKPSFPDSYNSQTSVLTGSAVSNMYSFSPNLS